ncbi:MAG: hypothetical protein Sapg2KO_34950 [Saprospiraceae bacterium]
MKGSTYLRACYKITVDPTNMQKKLKDLFGKDHGLDEKSIKFLTTALEKNNLPGFDYIEFKQALLTLESMNMEEETAFKSTFATASTLGLTKEKLVKTAEHYKKVLMNEKVQFDAALEKQIHQRVNAKEVELEKLKKQIDDYKTKIAQLEQKIASNQATIEKQDDVIQKAKDKIESTKDGFELTLQSLLNAIDKDIDTINLYI